MYASDIAAMPLQEMGGLHRADFLLNERLRWLIEVHRRDPPTPSEAGILFPGRDGMPASLEGYVVTYAVGLLVPNPMALGPGSAWNRCRSEAQATTSSLADACRALAIALTAADSRMMEIIGAGLARELAHDAQSRRTAEEAGRRIEWQTQELGRLAAARPEDSEAAIVRAILDPAVASEREAVEHQLREAGIPLDPPAGWRPPYR